jgi:hypothetical protein
MAISLAIKRILEEVAEELDEDINIVSLAVTSQFKFVTVKMKENLATKEDPTIALNYLGKFKVKKGRRMAIDNMREKETDKLFNIAKGDLK